MSFEFPELVVCLLFNFKFLTLTVLPFKSKSTYIIYAKIYINDEVGLLSSSKSSIIFSNYSQYSH